MIQGYYDGSSSPGVVGLAAYVAASAQWRTFEREWLALLAESGVPGIHMSDIYQRRDARAFKGKCHSEAVAAVGRCVEYLSGLHDWSFRRYSCVVIVDDYECARAHIPRIAGKPVEAFCVDRCVARVFMPPFRERDDPEGNVELYFDGNERFCHMVNRVFLRERRQKSGWMRYVRLIEPVDNSNNAVLPMQAADVLAWVARRYRVSGDHSDWHAALCGGRQTGTNLHHFFDYDALMAKYGGR